MADVNIVTAIQGIAQALSQLNALSNHLRNLENSLRDAGSGAGNAESATNRLMGAFRGLRGVLTTLGVGVAVKEIVDAAVQMDRLNSAMVSATGGFSDATKEMAFVRKEADSLGVSFDAAAKGFIKIAANAEGTVLEGKKTEDIFHGLATAASALRLSGDDLNGMLLAVGQMMSKGTVMSEELKLQIGERLPGSFAVAAEAMGVTTAELTKMMMNGQVITNDFLPKFAALLAQKYGEGAANAAKGLSASLTRLDNEWTQLMRDFGTANSGVIEGVTEKLRGLLGVVRDVGEGLGVVARSEIDDLNHKLDLERQRLDALNLAYEAAVKSQGTWSAAANNLRAQIDRSQAKIGDLTIQIRKLTPASNEAADAAKNMGNAVAQSSLTFDDFEVYLGDTVVKAEDLTKTLKKMTDEGIKAQQAELDKQVKSFENLIDRLTDLDPAVKQYIKDLEGIEALAKELNLTQDQQNKMIERAGNLFLDVVAPARDYGDELDRLARSLDANYNKTRTLEEADEIFSHEMAEGNLTIERRNELYNKLSSSLDEISNEKAPKVQQTFESLGSRITTTFQNTFQSILQNGDLTFSSLGKSILSMFTQIFSEIAARQLASFIGLPGAGGDIVSSGSGGGFIGSLMGMLGMGGGEAAVGAGTADMGFGTMQGMGLMGGGSIMGALGGVGIGMGVGGFFNNLAGGNSTNGMIGGGIGSLAGLALTPILGPFGPILGGIAGSLLGGLIGPPPPNHSTVAGFDFNSGSVNSIVSDPETSQQANQLFGWLSGFRNAIVSTTGATSSLTPIVPDIGKRDGIQVNGKTFALDDTAGAFDFLADQIVDSLTGISDAAKILLKSFEGAPEDLISFAQAIGTLDKFTTSNPFADFKQSLADASLTLTQSLARQRADIVSLARAYDGSLASTQQLAAATTAYQQNLVKLLTQIEAVKQNITQTFGSTAQQMQFGALTNDKARSAFYSRLVKGAQDALRNMGPDADPAEIQRQANIAQQNLLNMFNLLSANEKQSQLSAYLKALKDTEDLAQERLKEAKKAAKEQNKALQEIIKASMEGAAGTIGNAAEKIDAAAARIDNAARKMNGEDPIPIPAEPPTYVADTSSSSSTANNSSSAGIDNPGEQGAAAEKAKAQKEYDVAHKEYLAHPESYVAYVHDKIALARLNGAAMRYSNIVFGADTAGTRSASSAPVPKQVQTKQSSNPSRPQEISQTSQQFGDQSTSQNPTITAANIIEEAAAKLGTVVDRMDKASKRLADVNNAPISVSGVMVSNESSMRWLATQVAKQIQHQKFLEAL